LQRRADLVGCVDCRQSGLTRPVDTHTSRHKCWTWDFPLRDSLGELRHKPITIQRIGRHDKTLTFFESAFAFTGPKNILPELDITGRVRFYIRELSWLRVQLGVWLEEAKNPACRCWKRLRFLSISGGQSG